MTDLPPGPKSHPSTVACSKTHPAADRLFDALGAFDETVGILAAAESADWTPKARKRAVASLVAWDAIANQFGQLRGGDRRGRFDEIASRISHIALSILALLPKFEQLTRILEISLYR